MIRARWWRTGVAVIVAAALLGVPALSGRGGPVLSTSFEEDDLTDGWEVVTSGQGAAELVDVPASAGGGRALALMVPAAVSSSAAWLRGRIPSPLDSVTVTGSFNVPSTGCRDEHPSNPPLIRLFDTGGHRRVSVMVVRPQCRLGGHGELVVEHGGTFHATRSQVRLDEWFDVQLTASAEDAQPGTVEVLLQGRPVHTSLTARTGRAAFAEVGIANEKPKQVGSVVVAEVQVSEADTDDANGCQPRAEPRPHGADVLVADGFESAGFGQWTSVAATGSARIERTRTEPLAGRCTLRMSVPDDASARASLELAVPRSASAVAADGSFRVHADGHADSNTPLLRLFDGDRRVADVGRQHGTGALWLRTPRADGGWTYAPLGVAMALGSWHSVGLRAEQHADDTVFTVTVDAQAPVVIRTPHVRADQVDRVLLGSEHYSQEMDLSMDDVVVRAS